MSTEYSPFQKELSDLSAADLHTLRGVSEGWYVEYKRELPTAKVLAKSISAFANTYGGWLFLGVAEESKENAVAGAFPGIPDGEVDNSLQTLRHAIALHLSSAPRIDTIVLRGPSPDVCLEAGRSVICVRVPWSVNAPFVHSSGHIYRRVADGADPRPETDRHLLDQLWKRGDQLRRDYRRWVRRDPEFSKSEANTPYVRLLLVADLWRDKEPWLDFSLRQARQLFSADPARTSGVSCNAVHEVHGGFVARQSANNDPTSLPLTWILHRNLDSEILIPVNALRDARIADILTWLEEYDHRRQFIKLLQDGGARTVSVVDLNFLLRIIIGIAEQQEEILQHAGWNEDYHMKARLLNVWRTVPFIDTAEFIADCEAGGLPLGLSSKVTTPAGTTPDTFRRIQREGWLKSPGQDDSENSSRAADPPNGDTGQHSQELRVFMRALQMFIPVAQAFGVTIMLDEEEIYSFTDILDAGLRATKNQTARSQAIRRDA